MTDIKKFRGKSINTKEWVFGDLIHYPNGTVAIYDNMRGWAETAELVDPSTVGQLVEVYGGKDEVYEGDIVWVEYDPDVTDDESFSGVVKSSYHGGWSIFKEGGGTFSVNFSGSAVLSKHVIGDIYEGKEEA